MGKKGGGKRLPNSTSGPQHPISLREEATGKLHKKAGSNAKSMLKLEHLKNLAVLASREISIPSLGAFYGQCFASAEEAMGVPPDPSLLTCERCEIVLHPGLNCTIRIEKRRTKGKHRRNKFANVTQNNVVYKCHYCLHQNLKNGTSKGHIKGICPPKEKSSTESKHGQIPSHESGKSGKEIMNKDEANETNVFASQVAAAEVPAKHCPATPPITSLGTALDGNKRKSCTLGSNKATEPTSMSDLIFVVPTFHRSFLSFHRSEAPSLFSHTDLISDTGGVPHLRLFQPLPLATPSPTSPKPISSSFF